MKVKTNLVIYFFVCYSFVLNAQEKMSCFSFDRNKLKVLLVEIKDKKSKELRLRNFWTESFKNQNNSLPTVQEISEVLKENIKKLNIENNINNDKIFIISESRIFDESEIKAIQQDLDLAQFKNVDFISSSDNCKLLYKSLNVSEDAMIVDASMEHTYLIGNSINKNKDNVFDSFELKDTNYYYIKDKIKDVDSYKVKIVTNVNDLFLSNNFSKKNSKIYLTGDWSWAFYSLHSGGTIQDEFTEIKLEDLEKHQLNLQEKFYRYESLATANIEGERVLKNFTKEQLVLGNTILLSVLNNITDVKEKKIFYARNFSKAKMIEYLKAKI